MGIHRSPSDVGVDAYRSILFSNHLVKCSLNGASFHRLNVDKKLVHQKGAGPVMNVNMGNVNKVAGFDHFFVIKVYAVQKLHSSIFKIVDVYGVVDVSIRIAFVCANDKIRSYFHKWDYIKNLGVVQHRINQALKGVVLNHASSLNVVDDGEHAV